MLSPVIALLLAFLASTAAKCNFSKCFAGNYCTQLKAQPGAYSTAEACANQCADSKDAVYKFFSYVPVNKNCLCTTTCSVLIENPGADSYCINPTPTYALCGNNKQCGSNAQVKVQAGSFLGPQDCAAACYKANHAYSYFNYVPNSKQCSCTLTCDNTAQTYYTSNGSNAFKINSDSCVVGGK
jgi:hypothetical protein